MEDIFAWKVLEEATRIRSALKFPWKGPTNPRGGKVGASGNPGNNRHEWTFVKTTSAVETSLCGPDMKRQMWTKQGANLENECIGFQTLCQCLSWSIHTPQQQPLFKFVRFGLWSNIH